MVLLPGELCFENMSGETHPIQPDALSALFEQFANQVDCVLLNACHSEIQATAIANHIDFDFQSLPFYFFFLN